MLENRKRSQKEARALLRWSAERLAKQCDMSAGSIQTAERVDGIPTRMLYDSLLKIKTALERGGVEFGDNGEVKLRPKGRK
jgi:ribosome-binding protein aMBF1 (putative translation factor)